MTDEELLIQLEDCFTGGYTLPQYCIDNGIKKPLFVAEKKFCSSCGKFTFNFATIRE